MGKKPWPERSCCLPLKEPFMKRLSPLVCAWVLACLGALPMHTWAQTPKAVIETVEGYFDFVDAQAGTLTAEQIPAADYAKLFILDVRDTGQYAKEHIPGATQIEWRQVFAQRHTLPRDKTILLYCNTSSFAAQVAMALRLDGFENVRVLYGGYTQWKASGGLQAHARAQNRQ